MHTYVKMAFMMCIPAFFSIFFLPDPVVTVSVRNLRKKSGDLFIGWYVKPEGFRVLESAYYKRVVPVKDQETLTATFQVPTGTYAVAIFLDANRNGQLDTNFFGAPVEPYGFSQNNLFTFRPTSFEEAAFEVKDNTTLEIRLKQ